MYVTPAERSPLLYPKFSDLTYMVTDCERNEWDMFKYQGIFSQTLTGKDIQECIHTTDFTKHVQSHISIHMRDSGSPEQAHSSQNALPDTSNRSFEHHGGKSVLCVRSGA